MIENNICLLTDSFKITHHYFYPEGTQKVYSYLENRSEPEFNKTVFYGLQYILKKYLAGKVVTQEKIDEADELMKIHLGEGFFNREGWEYILDKYDGKLPIEIMAVPEGTPVDASNVLMTVVNTDDECFWLTNYLESILLQVWYPSTVATLSAEVKKIANYYLESTGSSKDTLDIMLNDFGYRGATSIESSMICGSAHLLNFAGTDTAVALSIPINYYNDPNIYGFSVQATEHSIMTSLGKDGEMEQALHVINNAKNGNLALVIDSYDYRKFLFQASTKGCELNDAILNYLSVEGNLIVFAPDSGEPTSTILKTLDILGEGFGTYRNEKGYKVLDANIGVLWGDGLDYHKLNHILFAMKANGWAAQNIIFGMSGGLHTNVNRDTQNSVFKCSAQQRNGQWFDVFKDPLDSYKKSKAGRFKLIKENGSFKTVPIDDPREDLLQCVFRNGDLLVDEKFSDVKLRAQEYYK